MNYKEYAGIRGLVIAEVIKDDATGYVTGNWQELAGVQSLAHAKSEESEVHYYDNIGAIIVDAQEGDEVTMTVSIPANKTRALIEGVEYDETTDMIIRTPAKKKYFSLGYIGLDTDGKEEINILYKGKFSGGNKSHETKNDGTTTTNMEYTYTAVHTSNKINGTSHAMAIEVPVSEDVTEANVFGTFADGVSTEKALTPVELKALASA